MEIKAVSVKDILDDPEFGMLAENYTLESGNPFLGRSKVFDSGYMEGEQKEMLSVFGAYEDSVLVGFACIGFTLLPHYSQLVGVIDSVYLKPSSRRGTAGLRLIRKCFQSAKEHGCVGIYMTAPYDSRLAKLYSRIGNITDSVFWKSC